MTSTPHAATVFRRLLRSLLGAASLAAAVASSGCELPSRAAASMIKGSVNEYNKILAKEKTTLLLWNIARTYNNEPIHFIQASQLTAQFSAEISGGIKLAYESGGDHGGGITAGGSFSVNPTIQLVPIQGTSLQDFLRPIRSEVAIGLLWHASDENIRDVLSLMAHEFVALEGPHEPESYVIKNRTHDRVRFSELLKRIQGQKDDQELRLVSLESWENLGAPAVMAPSPENVIAAESKGMRWRRTDGKYSLSRASGTSRHALIDFEEGSLKNSEKQKLLERMKEDPFQDSLIPIWLKNDETTWIRGFMRLRNMADILTFVADGVIDSDAAGPKGGEQFCPLQVIRSKVKPRDVASWVLIGDTYFWASRKARSRKAFSLLFMIHEAKLSDPKGILPPVLTLPAGKR